MTIRVASLLAVLVLLAGCGTYASPPGQPCSPAYAAPKKYGRLAVQQAGPGKPIHWGAYPAKKYQGDLYDVEVFLDGRSAGGGKPQPYPPHGSVGAQRAKKYSGKTFEMRGRVESGGKLVFNFTLYCTVA